jgi:hypothetical protein
MRSATLRRHPKSRDQPIRLTAAILSEKLQTGYVEPQIHTMSAEIRNARIEHAKSPARRMTALLKYDTELFKHFMGKTSFRGWMSDSVPGLSCEPAGAGGAERP